MAAKYSLANYIVTFSANDNRISEIINDISIGGKDDTLDSITISRANDLFSVTGYATGGYVFDKSLDRTGSVTLSISQLAAQIPVLKNLCQVLESEDGEGLTITVRAAGSTDAVAECIDCFPTKIPDQAFGSSSANQSWEFICGQVNFK